MKSNTTSVTYGIRRRLAARFQRANGSSMTPSPQGGASCARWPWAGLLCTFGAKGNAHTQHKTVQTRTRLCAGSMWKDVPGVDEHRGVSATCRWRLAPMRRSPIVRMFAFRNDFAPKVHGMVAQGKLAERAPPWVQAPPEMISHRRCPASQPRASSRSERRPGSRGPPEMISHRRCLAGQPRASSRSERRPGSRGPPVDRLHAESVRLSASGKLG